MAEVKKKHFLNGKEFGGEMTWRDTEIKLSFDNFSKLSFNISSINLVGEIVDDVYEHLEGGITGGGGYFEAMDYRYEVGDLQSKFIFHGITDWADESTLIGTDEVQVKIKEKQGFDWLTEVAGGYSFASLYGEGIITNQDFVSMGYVLNYVPDFMQVLMLGFGVFILVKELIQLIKEISSQIAEIVNAVTPNTGIFITWDIGDVIWFILELIGRLIYAIAIVIALVNLVKLIFEQLVPKRRKHLGMKISTMFERICDKMGYTFSSELIYNTDVKDWALIPRKFEKGGEGGETGYPDAKSPIYTADRFIAIMMEMFNAKPTLIDGVFHFERIDKEIVNNTFIISPYYNDQDSLRMQEKKNLSEIKANYNISFNFDLQDQNSLDVTDGFHFQQQLTNSGTIDPAKNLLKGLTEIDLPFCLGLDKVKLNFFEKALKVFATITDSITGVLGTGTNFVSKIEARVGSCLQSSHFTSVMKLVSLQGENLKPNQRKVVSAKFLWDNFHYINSGMPIKGKHNQWKIYESTPVLMDDKKLLSLINNNIVTDDEGRPSKITEVLWPPDSDIAKITYRVNELYHTSFTAKYYE